MFDSLLIDSPKRKKYSKSQLEEFFPYYAGFPESFASTIIESSGLDRGGIIYDPWNGSGTTTAAAAMRGYNYFGVDINPVMVLVARARNLSITEAHKITLQIEGLLRGLNGLKSQAAEDDPLLQWFQGGTANLIRNFEKRIRSCSVERSSKIAVRIDDISPFVAALYVVLFTVCRDFTLLFRSSNPTWLKPPRFSEDRVRVEISEFRSAIRTQMRRVLGGLRLVSEQASAMALKNIVVGDSTSIDRVAFADLILTSPPYCTRIDYTAATRVELAVIDPLLALTRSELSQRMIGSIKVPLGLIEPRVEWGRTCGEFISRLLRHDSKASRGYYYKTHLDYFDKMFRSLCGIQRSLKVGAAAVLVVQDSHYKEIHNDVPLILTEMADASGLELFRREDFLQKNSMSGINTRSKKYRDSASAVESVLCFIKRK
ncbi:DNA methyltransferase [Pseudomonas donghuensis]|uniref:DNA methyltransferase n=1 Tax=Pseudomonas donghuensis TaxID=1163398 RepID=UPI00167B94D1|nr:DNA methyltransferase [Pseudomonas donghuensis]WKY30266.1 DNA methyltransferase [Pseudomonas donghuensis]